MHAGMGHGCLSVSGAAVRVAGAGRGRGRARRPAGIHPATPAHDRVSKPASLMIKTTRATTRLTPVGRSCMCMCVCVLAGWLGRSRWRLINPDIDFRSESSPKSMAASLARHDAVARKEDPMWQQQQVNQSG